MNNTYEDFIVEFKRLSGIDLALYKERQMKRRIESFIAKNNYNSYVDYFLGLKQNAELLDEFLKHITINVSEFFRNYKNWETLENELLPTLIKNNRNLRIWSAACSTGEEPYSLAMMLSKHMSLQSIKILATDIDDEVLEKAQLGVYKTKNLEGAPREYTDKFFIKDEETCRVKDEIKKCVEFKKHNLLADPYPKEIDLIVCRNVLIYFTEEAKEKIYENFNKSLVNDGILFVGSTEQIIMCNKYKLTPVQTFFYKKYE